MQDKIEPKSGWLQSVYNAWMNFFSTGKQEPIVEHKFEPKQQRLAKRSRDPLPPTGNVDESKKPRLEGCLEQIQSLSDDVEPQTPIDLSLEDGSASIIFSERPVVERIPKLYEWLNDETIRQFFEVIKAKHPTTTFIDPLCFKEGKLTRAQHLKKIKKELMAGNINTTFFPMRIEFHWYLSVVLKVNENTFKIYALDGQNNDHQMLFTEVEDILKQIYPEVILETPAESLIIPQQLLQHCGYIICFFAEKFALGPNELKIAISQYGDAQNCTYISETEHVLQVLSDSPAKNKVLWAMPVRR